MKDSRRAEPAPLEAHEQVAVGRLVTSHHLNLAVVR